MPSELKVKRSMFLLCMDHIGLLIINRIYRSRVRDHYTTDFSECSILSVFHDLELKLWHSLAYYSRTRCSDASC